MNAETSATNVETVVKHPAKPTFKALMVPMDQKFEASKLPYPLFCNRYSNATAVMLTKLPKILAKNVPAGNHRHDSGNSVHFPPLKPDKFHRSNAPVGATSIEYIIVRYVIAIAFGAFTNIKPKSRIATTTATNVAAKDSCIYGDSELPVVYFAIPCFDPDDATDGKLRKSHSLSDV